jgi:lysozyme family protein
MGGGRDHVLRRVGEGRAFVKDNFSLSIALVLRSEGGYVNNATDKGGPTNRGITQATYDRWRSLHGLPLQPVARISGVEVEAIYHAFYWQPVHGDDLPAGVDYATFDFAVNSGDTIAEKDLQHDININRAIRFMQRGAAVVEDGVIGPVTLAALQGIPPAQVIDTLCDERVAYLKTLSRFPIFGKGWLNRVESVRAQAKAMAA